MALDWATLAPLLADTAANYDYSSNEAQGYTAKPSTGYELVGNLLLDLNGMGPPAGLPSNIRYLPPAETQALLQRSEAEANSGLSNQIGNFIGDSLPAVLMAAGAGAAGAPGLLQQLLEGTFNGGAPVASVIEGGITPQVGGVSYDVPNLDPNGIWSGNFETLPPTTVEEMIQAASGAAPAGGMGTGISAGLYGSGLGAAGAAAAAGLGGEAAGAALGSSMIGAGAPAAGASALGGGSGAVGTAAAGTALSRILDGTATTADWLSLAGPALGTGLGIAGSLNQKNSLEDLARQQREADAAKLAAASADSAATRAAEQARYDDLVRREAERFGVITAREDAAKAQQRADIEFGRGLGAPSRERYEASYAPGFPNGLLCVDNRLSSASSVESCAMASAGSLVMSNPGGLTQVNKDVLSGVALPYLQDYRRTNATTGGLASFGSSGATVPGIGTNLPTTATAGSGTPISGTTTATGVTGPNQFDLAGAQAGGNLWNTIGSGVADIFTPKNSLADLLKLLRP